MLNSTRELAILLPRNVFDDFDVYLDEVSRVTEIILAETSQAYDYEFTERLELTFLIRFIQTRYLDRGNTFTDLIEFFRAFGLEGFRYENNIYSLPTTLEPIGYLALSRRVNSAIRQLLAETETNYLLDFADDEAVIQRVINDHRFNS